MKQGVKQSKYKVSLAVANSWFPGHTIESFEIIVQSTKVLYEPYLIDQAKERGFTNFEIIGTVLVQKGAALKASSDKTNTPVK